MARAPVPPPARIAQLRRAKERATKLKSQDLSANPMAELLGVSWGTLRKWCDDVPELAKYDAFVRGGNGIEWAFRPLRMVNALIDHFEKAHKAGVKRAKRVKQIIAGDKLDDAPDDLSVDELTKMVRLSREIREEQERQGQLVNAERVRGCIRLFMSAIQEAALRAAQEQDPNGRWPADIRESFENATQSILLSIERAGIECLDGF